MRRGRAFDRGAVRSIMSPPAVKPSRRPKVRFADRIVKRNGIEAGRLSGARSDAWSFFFPNT
jgi:hypothetical protein